MIAFASILIAFIAGVVTGFYQFKFIAAITSCAGAFMIGALLGFTFYE